MEFLNDPSKLSFCLFPICIRFRRFDFKWISNFSDWYTLPLALYHSCTYTHIHWCLNAISRVLIALSFNCRPYWWLWSNGQSFAGIIPVNLHGCSWLLFGWEYCNEIYGRTRREIATQCYRWYIDMSRIQRCRVSIQLLERENHVIRVNFVVNL